MRHRLNADSVTQIGGGGGIRTHVGALAPHPISSRCRYGHFGTPPYKLQARPELYTLNGFIFQSCLAQVALDLGFFRFVGRFFRKPDSVIVCWPRNNRVEC